MLADLLTVDTVLRDRRRN